MNKSIYIVMLSLVCFLCLTSCHNEEDDIFDRPSAERTNEAVKGYNELLCSSPAGWVMEYFANETEPGCTFIMKFSKDTSVDITSKNKWTSNKMLSESSLFEMIADNGPVLTFNTYNSLFHFFSTPEDIPSTDEDENGRGFLGDYEFIVMNADDNTINLKGKKGGLQIIMHRLAEGQDQAAYYAKLDAVDKSLFSPKITKLFLSADGENYTISNASNYVMHFVPENGDPISQTTKVAFIVTESGIRLVKPFEGDNKSFSVQDFKIADNGALQCTDEENPYFITALPAADIFKEPGMTWRIDKTRLTGKFASAYDKVVEQSKSVFNLVFQYFEFKYDGKASRNALSFKNGKSTGMIYIDINNIGDTKTKVSIVSEGEGDNNGLIHLEKVPAYGEFLQLLTSSEYEITVNSVLKPTELIFTSLSDPNDSFTVTVQ